MAYDSLLSDRISMVLKHHRVNYTEKKMMGGLCYLVDDKMLVGIVKDELMVRIDPEIHEEALVKPGCREMDFTGRPMRGFVFVGNQGIDSDGSLEEWIQLALEYNPRAKSSKKKK